MIIRDANSGDVPRCNEVWLSTQPDVEPGRIPDQPLSMHEIDTGRLLVAEVDGEIVGFGATLTRSGVLYLADLFVVPAHQNRGVGRQLADALCGLHEGPLFTFASSDPRAGRLYTQLGMPAVDAYHYLDVPAATLTPWATDIDLVEADRADVLVLDEAITGRDRLVDVDYASAIGAIWYVAERRGRRVGVLAVAPMWWNPWHPRAARLGPCMVDSPDDLAPLISAGLTAARSSAADVDFVCTFASSSLVALPQLLAAGFVIADTDLFMSSDPALLDSYRYMPTVDTP